MKPLRALLVNPYIYDFSAYSFWSSPLGLLYVGSILRKNGIEIDLIDCLRVVEEKRKMDGRAPFIKEKMDPPVALKGVKKRYRRYGISRTTFLEELSLQPPPDLVIITSVMTYWYAGTKEVLRIVRDRFPSSKIVVGGIYPSLCYEHAVASLPGADLIVKNNEITKFYDFVEREFLMELSFRPSPYDFENLPYPCYDLYDTIPFVPLLFSYGCAYHCSYCATPHLHPSIVRRGPGSLVREILHWRQYDVKRFVLYDDNFLYKKEDYAKPLLNIFADLPFPLEIYNPNALNAVFIDEEMAELLARAGFKEVRMGLETVNPALQMSTGDKVDLRRFERAAKSLVAAGFKKNSIKAYIMAGLPLQRWEEVKEAIDYCSGLGVTACIAEYTPIPHTPLFELSKHLARYPIAEDPIYQNNALSPFAWEGFTDKDLVFLKHCARERG